MIRLNDMLRLKWINEAYPNHKGFSEVLKDYDDGLSSSGAPMPKVKAPKMEKIMKPEDCDLESIVLQGHKLKELRRELKRLNRLCDIGLAFQILITLMLAIDHVFL